MTLGRADAGSWNADRAGVERLKDQPGHGVIQRHRALQKGDPGERDDADAVT